VRVVLLAVDDRTAASGRKFATTDDELFTMRQRVECVAARVGADLELAGMPCALGHPFTPTQAAGTCAAPARPGVRADHAGWQVSAA
jgi:hypothetical protein